MRLGTMVLITALAVELLSALIGCRDTHEITRTRGTAGKLDRLTSVYVARSPDSYEPFSRIAAQKVAAAFSPYVFPTVAARQEEMGEALESAKNRGFTYLLYPEILHWEAIEWSAKPDQVSVKVSLIHARTGAVLDSAVVSGESGLFTFGRHRPEDLLSKPLADYASSLLSN